MTDLYAKGYEAGLEQARRAITQNLDEPRLALDQIHALLVEGARNRGRLRAMDAKRKQAERRKKERDAAASDDGPYQSSRSAEATP